MSFAPRGPGCLVCLTCFAVPFLPAPSPAGGASSGRQIPVGQHKRSSYLFLCLVQFLNLFVWRLQVMWTFTCIFSLVVGGRLDAGHSRLWALVSCMHVCARVHAHVWGLCADGHNTRWLSPRHFPPQTHTCSPALFDPFLLFNKILKNFYIVSDLDLWYFSLLIFSPY